MDGRAHDQITRQLDAGERLLWSGAPARGFRLQGSGALFVPFSLLWGAFAIVWQLIAVYSDVPLLFTLWGVPFVLFALYLIVGRFFWDSRRRAATAYAVTDRRVILVTEFPFPRMRTLNLRSLSDV